MVEQSDPLLIFMGLLHLGVVEDFLGNADAAYLRFVTAETLHYDCEFLLTVLSEQRHFNCALT